MATPVMTVRDLVELAEQLIDSIEKQTPPGNKRKRLPIRDFMKAVGSRTNTRGGDPGRASRAISWAYAKRGVGKFEDVLRLPQCEPEFASLVGTDAAQVADSADVPEADPVRFEPIAERLRKSALKELSELAGEIERIERTAADERVESVRRELTDDLHHCKDHLTSAIDAEVAAVAEAESLRVQLDERRAVVATLESRIEALETLHGELRAAELRERELRGKAESEVARLSAELRHALAHEEAARADTNRWRDRAADASARAEARVADVERAAEKRVADIRALYDRLASQPSVNRPRGESRRKVKATVGDSSKK